jgi:hypothetical protein
MKNSCAGKIKKKLAKAYDTTMQVLPGGWDIERARENQKKRQSKEYDEAKVKKTARHHFDPHENRENKDVKKIKKAATDIEKHQPKKKPKPKKKAK